MRMQRKKAIGLIVGICAVALVAWIVLMVTVFRDKEEEKKPFVTPTPYQLPEVPEGSVLVWRLLEVYDVPEKGAGYYSYRYTYDDKGRCISALRYDEPDHVEMEFMLSYDETTGRTTVTRLESSYGTPGVFSTKYVTVYDAQGRAVSKEHSELENGVYVPSSKDEIDFDDQGRPTARRVYDSFYTGQLILCMERTYDPLGYVLSEYDRYRGKIDNYTRDPYGHVIEHWTEWPTEEPSRGRIVDGESELDDEGRVVLRREPWWVEGADGEYVEAYLEYRYTYSDDGTWRNEWYSEDGRLREVQEFDVYGNITLEKEFYEDGTVSGWESVYQPRFNGRVLQSSKYKEDGSFEYTYRSEYDDFGNRVRTYTLEDGKWELLYEDSYDAEGRRTGIQRAYHSVDYRYDEYGNCVETVYHMKDGGDSVEYYTYVPFVITKEQAEQPDSFSLPELYLYPGLLEPESKDAGVDYFLGSWERYH